MEGRGSKELELRDCRSYKLEDPSPVGRGSDTQVSMAVTQGAVWCQGLNPQGLRVITLIIAPYFHCYPPLLSGITDSQGSEQ